MAVCVCVSQLASAEYGSFDIFGLHPVYCLGQAHEMQLVQSEGWHYKPAGPDAVGAPARGPLTTDAMRALYASGSLPPTTLVRRQCAAAGEPDAGGVNDAKWVEVAGVATIAVAGPEAVDRGATEPSTAAAVQAEPSAASRPTLYLRVCTVDSWERFRLLGYGLVALPQAAGRLKLPVPTWRPASDRLANLRTAFVGGSPELEPWCPVCRPRPTHPPPPQTIKPCPPCRTLDGARRLLRAPRCVLPPSLSCPMLRVPR